MVSGYLLIHDMSIYVLFDTGATHSIVAEHLENNLRQFEQSLEFPLLISTPMGSSVCIVVQYKECPLVIGNRIRKITLFPMKMNHFDIIVGMDWLSEHRAVIDCDSKQVIFGDKVNPECVFQGVSPKPGSRVISIVEVKALNSQSCEGSLDALQNPGEVQHKPEDIHIVNEFLDVFPDELPGVSPEREVQFSIDLVPGASPI